MEMEFEIPTMGIWRAEVITERMKMRKKLGIGVWGEPCSLPYRHKAHRIAPRAKGRELLLFVQLSILFKMFVSACFNKIFLTVSP